MSKRKPNNHLSRARRMVEGNLQKHAVVFTVSLGRAYFVNRANPKAPTFVTSTTQAAFDPDQPIYSKLRFNWKFYPVISYKDRFGNFDKMVIVDVGYDLPNAKWTDAIEAALIEANKHLGEVEQKWRMNCGIVFAIDKAPMTVEKIEQILAMDEQFTVWDPDREIRTSEEIAADELELAARLESLDKTKAAN